MVGDVRPCLDGIYLFFYRPVPVDPNVGIPRLAKVPVANLHLLETSNPM